jgi:hypothetical protein
MATPNEMEREHGRHHASEGATRTLSPHCAPTALRHARRVGTNFTATRHVVQP